MNIPTVLTAVRAAEILRLNPANWSREARAALAAVADGKTLCMAAEDARDAWERPDVSLYHVTVLMSGGDGALRAIYATIAANDDEARQQVEAEVVALGRDAFVSAVERVPGSNPRAAHTIATLPAGPADLALIAAQKAAAAACAPAGTIQEDAPCVECFAPGYNGERMEGGE